LPILRLNPHHYPDPLSCPIHCEESVVLYTGLSFPPACYYYYRCIIRKVFALQRRQNKLDNLLENLVIDHRAAYVGALYFVRACAANVARCVKIGLKRSLFMSILRLPRPGTLKRATNAVEEAAVKRSRTSSASSGGGGGAPVPGGTPGSTRNSIDSSYSSSRGLGKVRPRPSQPQTCLRNV